MGAGRGRRSGRRLPLTTTPYSISGSASVFKNEGPTGTVGCRLDFEGILVFIGAAAAVDDPPATSAEAADVALGAACRREPDGGSLLSFLSLNTSCISRSSRSARAASAARSMDARASSRASSAPR